MISRNCVRFMRVPAEIGDLGSKLLRASPATHHSETPPQNAEKFREKTLLLASGSSALGRIASPHYKRLDWSRERDFGGMECARARLRYSGIRPTMCCTLTGTWFSTSTLGPNFPSVLSTTT